MKNYTYKKKQEANKKERKQTRKQANNQTNILVNEQERGGLT